jgi:hypothetical protein
MVTVVSVAHHPLGGRSPDTGMAADHRVVGQIWRMLGDG